MASPYTFTRATELAKNFFLHDRHGTIADMYTSELWVAQIVYALNFVALIRKILRMPLQPEARDQMILEEVRNWLSPPPPGFEEE